MEMMYSAADSTTHPSHLGLGFKDTATGPAQWTVTDTTAEAVENAERIADLRRRMETYGHQLPLSIIQDEIRDVGASSQTSSIGTTEVSVESLHIQQCTSSTHVPVGARIPPIRSAFAEIGAAAEPLSSERWFPRLPTPRSNPIGPPQVIDYTKSYTISNLASEIGTKPESPVGTPASQFRRSRGFEPYRRRDSRAARQPQQPSLKSELLKSAPWAKNEPTPEEPRSPPTVAIVVPPPEPETSLFYTNGRMNTGEQQKALLEKLRTSPQLTSLDLSYNPALSDLGVMALADAIMTHKGLRRVNLMGCCIADCGAKVLSDYMGLTGLVRLDLRWNGITKAGAWVLRRGVEHGVSVKTLLLRDTRLVFDVRRTFDAYGRALKVGLKVNQNGLILHVGEGSPASAAELHEPEPEAVCEDDPDSTGTFPRRLLPGMVLTRINGKKVASETDISKVMSKIKGDTIQFSVKSNRIPSKSLGKLNKALQFPKFNSEPEETTHHV